VPADTVESLHNDVRVANEKLDTIALELVHQKNLLQAALEDRDEMHRQLVIALHQAYCWRGIKAFIAAVDERPPPIPP
jgi:hypothetical protein